MKIILIKASIYQGKEFCISDDGLACLNYIKREFKNHE